MLGGDHSAYPDGDGQPGAPWFPALESLLRKAVRNKVPTLGICLGGQLLAAAHGGSVERSAAGPGDRGEAWSPAGTPPRRTRSGSTSRSCPTSCSGTTTRSPSCPPAPVLLAASTNYPHQAFRIGERAWGPQFHIECDVDMIAAWAGSGTLSDRTTRRPPSTAARA